MASFKFNPKTQRYQYTDGAQKGKFVAAEALRGLTGDYISQQSDVLQDLTKRMLNKRIGVSTWVNEVAAVLKESHINGYAIGAGGKAQLDSSHYGSIGAILKEEYKYLHQFGRDILDKKLSKAQIKARVDLYAGAIRRSYEKGRENSHDRNGFNWERRDRHVTDSCSDCVGYEAQGWVELGTLPAPGERCQCHRNCKCSKRYSSNKNRPVNNILDHSFGWIGTMTTATQPTAVSLVLEAVVNSIKGIDASALEQALAAMPVDQQAEVFAMAETEDEEGEEEEFSRVELSIEGFYNGTPKPPEAKMIAQFTGYPCDPDDWEMVTLRASDNLTWKSFRAVWHPNVLNEMVKQYPGKTLLMDHGSSRIENSRGFFVKSVMIQDETAPDEILNNMGRGKMNRSIVKDHGWQQVVLMAAVHKDESALLSRIKSRAVHNTSTGTMLENVQHICPHCSKKMGREVESQEKDGDGKYVCPHEVPTWVMLWLADMGYFDKDVQFMDYVIINGGGMVHGECSFVTEGNLASAGVIRS